MQRKYQYISADNHLNTHWLPKDLWRKRLPASLRDKGPQVIETDDGSYWYWEGRRSRSSSADGSSHHRLAQLEFGMISLEDGVMPPSNPEMVIRHMDLANVQAAVFYGDTRKWAVDDAALRIAMYRAYNDFCLELSGHDPQRLIYLPNLPTNDPDACLAEFYRVAELGVRAVEFSVFDIGAELSSPVWEPLWEQAAGQDIVVCSHTGHGAGVPFAPNERGASHAAHATSPFSAAKPIAEMIFSGVFERHPALKWVMAECRIGWLPFLFSWMDRQVEIRAPDTSASISLMPSEYVRRNIRFTFERDIVGARLLHYDWSLLGDTVMWGNDYPHPQGMWPDPGPIVDKMFTGIDPALRHEILYGRAARLYGIETPELVSV